MKLMPFTDAAYKRVIDSGYKYIVVGNRIKQPSPIYTNGRPLQILKAVLNCNNLPDGSICEAANSGTIQNLLTDTQTDYFIILTGEDDAILG